MTTRIAFTKGVAVVTIHNTTIQTLSWQKGDTFGYVDLRSVGYFHVSGANMIQLLNPSFEMIGIDQLLGSFENPTISNIRTVEREDEIRPLQELVKKHTTKPRSDPYPWLDKQDPRRSKTDEQLIREQIKIAKASPISKEEQELFMKLLIKYREVFSIRDEIGLCPSMKVQLYLKDETPFFIRPYPIKPEKRGMSMPKLPGGTFWECKTRLSGYTSPIMLIPRKNSQILGWLLTFDI